MIGKFELCQAARHHIEQMLEIDETCKSLDVDVEQFVLLIEAMTVKRVPEETAKTKDLAYYGGMIDGFLLGIKAQLAEWGVICERCGNTALRGEDDPVPEDYDPTKHKMICKSCLPAATAHLN